MKILELFSGIGGMHTAVNETLRDANIVSSYEINSNALSIYNLNYCKNEPIKSRNIMSLTAESLEYLKPDLIVMSPPCQPFTRQGLKHDIGDNRCQPFLHILSVLDTTKFLPSKILLENVAGFEDSIARDNLLELLVRKRYHFQEFLVSPKHIHIPNSRLRYYLLASQSKDDFHFTTTEKILQEFPTCICLQQSEESVVVCCQCSKPVLIKVQYLLKKFLSRLKDYSEPLQLASFIDTLEDDTPYRIPDKILLKYGTVLDIVTKNSTGSCCFTSGYGRYAQGTGSIYCPLAVEDVCRVYDELKTVSIDDPNYLVKLSSLQLRYFTPREILRLMCFPAEFQVAEKFTLRQCYKVLGNSINVLVVSLLITLIT